jgi:hypothetical protein
MAEVDLGSDLLRSARDLRILATLGGGLPEVGTWYGTLVERPHHPGVPTGSNSTRSAMVDRRLVGLLAVGAFDRPVLS